MASYTKRTIILISCRALNYGVLLLSPVFLVRIFDVHSYGQYREFVLYAVLFSSFLGFSINSNLLYFIPKYPELERESVTHTALLALLSSSIGIVAIYLGRNLILSYTSYDFIIPLVLYIFFFLNLDFCVSYWLGKKRSDYVLYYSTVHAILRLCAILASAFFTRDVLFVLKAMVGVEFIKCLFLFLIFRRFFTKHIDNKLIKEQLKFVIPLGSASVIFYLNNQLAKLFVSAAMGVERLAFYVIGSYQIPIMGIVRSSVMDVLFPEMVQKNVAGRLLLWQRANVVFCSITFPIFIIFFYYAEIFIETLFTKEYLAAVPLFRIYLLLMLRQCFEMGTPLRAINQNKFFIIGNVFSLIVNIGAILILFRYIGFIAPAIGFILADLALVIYLGGKILKYYSTNIKKLFMWKKVFTIACGSLLCLPILFLGEMLTVNCILRAVMCSVFYLVTYVVFMKKCKIDEVDFIIGQFTNKMKMLHT